MARPVGGSGSDATIHPAIIVALDRVAGDCEARHDRTNGVALKALTMADAARVRLAVISGEDGKGGTCMRHDTRLDKIEDILDRQRSFLIKVALIVAGAAFGGGGLVQFLITSLKGG